MKKLLFLFRALAFSAIAIFAVSCSDDSSTSNPVTPSDTTKVTGDYFKIGTGNYWTYIQYDRDQANAKDLTTKRNDSVVVNESLTMFSKTSYKLQHFKAGESNPYYAYVENSCLYNDVLSLLPSSSAIPLPTSQIVNQWVKVADMNATSKWTLFTQSFSDIDVPITATISGKLTATYTASAEKKTKSSTTIGGKVYDTQEFVLTHNIKGSVKVALGLANLDLPIEVNIITHDVYAKDLGKISTWTESTKQDFTIIGLGTQTIPINGSEAYINTFSVK